MKEKRKYSLLIEKIIGSSGTIIFGLPQIILSIYLSNFFGVREAGEFIVIYSLTSLIHSISLFGIRSNIVITTSTDDNKNYIYFRFITSIISVLAIGSLIEVNSYLTIVILFLKLSESVIELNFSFIQRDFSSMNAQKHLLFFSSVRLIGVFLSLLIYHFYFNELITLIILILFFILILRPLLKYFSGQFSWTKLYKILSDCFPFAFATGICASLTNSPRLILKYNEFSDNDGLIAIALSVASILGILFNIEWQRYLSLYRKYSKSNKFQFDYFKALIQTFLFLGVPTAILASVITPILYGINLKSSFISFLIIMVCSLIFSLGITIQNLYKLSNLPYLESISYSIALLLFGGTHILLKIPFEYSLLLAGLFLILTPYFFKLNKKYI